MTVMTRRTLIAALQLIPCIPPVPYLVQTDTAQAAQLNTLDTFNDGPESFIIELEADGGVFCVRYTIDGRPFRGVLDTGSPFLTVGTGIDSSCSYWGCWEDEGIPTDLEDTFEMFAAQDGNVQWRRGKINLSLIPGLQQTSVPVRQQTAVPGQQRITIPGSGAINSNGLIFGVFQSLVSKGGTTDQSLFGLVKNTSPGIRPSLLGQTSIQSFSLNFETGQLLLSRQSLVPRGCDWVPLVDLRKVAGAPSQQYVVQLSAVYINGQKLNLPDGCPAYGMLDSGSTGLYISERLYHPLQREARGWRSCDVEFQTIGGNTVRLSAGRPSPQFLCLSTDFPWLQESEGYMFVLGTVFLAGSTMTVDMDNARLLLQTPQRLLQENHDMYIQKTTGGSTA